MTVMDAELKAYLATLVWDDGDKYPAADLIDDVTMWLQEHYPTKSYEDCADWADRLVLARLK